MAEETNAVAPPSPPSSLAGPLILLTWLALGGALAALPQYTGVLTFAFVGVGWVLAVALHEFGHAAVAYLGGDHTVRDKGYLTLDPRRYTDLGVTLVVPLLALALGGVGFPGGAVYLREDLMRSRAWRSASSLAGPAGTLVVLIVLGLAIGPAAGQGLALLNAVAFLAFLQGTALVLNLLPVPGLDGFGVLRPFLPQALAKRLAPIEGVAALVFLALLFFLPGVSSLLFGAALLITDAVGVPSEAIQGGWEAFRFWR